MTVAKKLQRLILFACILLLARADVYGDCDGDWQISTPMETLIDQGNVPLDCSGHGPASQPST